MEEIKFASWGKIPRLFRDITITEKIDGTNAAIGIMEFPFGWHVGGTDENGVSHDQPEHTMLAFHPDPGHKREDGFPEYDDGGLPDYEYLVYAQSRTRLINPAMDNYGFARWAWSNASTLVADLGPGLHYGEWWGNGIQRGYGVPDKRLSLFNTGKWADKKFATPNLMSVPVIWGGGTFDTENVRDALWLLELHGSMAAPGFKPAEGVCVFHHASREIFKATILNDDTPKSKAA